MIDERTAEVTLKVNSEQARKEFEELQEKAARLRKEFADAFRRGDTRAIREINRDLQRVNREIDNCRTNAANIRAAMMRINEASPRDLQRTIKAINAELNSGRVVRGSKEWNSYIEKLRLVKAELRKVQTELNESEGFFTRFSNTFTKWWGSYTIITDAIGQVNLKLSKMKQDFRDKESSQANLKALTGLDDSSIEWLTRQAEKLSTTMDETGLRITQSSKEILDAYMLVGSNKPELLTDKQALNDVTVEAMRLAAAAKMKLQPAVDAMTTALNQFGEGADKAGKYVNILAAGSKFGAANVEQQSASILKSGTAAASANVSFEELVGSIEMLGEKGIKGEIAGTGLKKFFLVLQTGAAETNPKVVGLSTALNNLKAQVDAAERQSVGGGASFLKKMFGEEAYSIAAILTDNTAKVREYTAAVTDTTTALEQAATNSDTTDAKMEQMRNKFKEVGIELVEKLNPSLGILVSWNTKFISQLPGVIDWIMKHRSTVMALIAAYTAYKLALIGQTAATKAHTVMITALTSAKRLWRATTISCRLALIALTQGFDTARRAIRLMNATMATTPWGAAAALIGVLTGALVGLVSAHHRAKSSEKMLSDIRKNAEKDIVSETNKINLLISAAQNEYRTLDERKAAIDRLNSIIPGYNASIDETTNKYTASTTALESYIDALRKKYELEGAKEKLSELGRQKADSSILLAKANEDLVNAKALPPDLNKSMYEGSVGIEQNHRNNRTLAIQSANARIKEANKKLKDIEEAENLILGIYQEALESDAINSSGSNSPDNDNDGGHQEPTDSDEKRKNALKAALEEEKKLKLQAEVENTLLYAQGLKTYSEYCSDKEKIESESLERQKDIHEQHGKSDLQGYLQVLTSRANLKKKAEDNELKKSLDKLEAEHKAAEDSAVKLFHDQRSEAYQNQTLLNQRLLDADLTYLRNKAKLYEAGSKERADIERQIEEREEKDKLDKQKGLLEQLKRIRQEYLNDPESQKQTELDILETLYKAKILKEEEYQRAKKAIEAKYRENRLKEETNAQSREADILKALYENVKNIKEHIGVDWKELFKDITKLAEDTFTMMAGYMQLYSAYSSASRDLELANIEKYYDNEVKSAGKNQKKKAKLEEQKEEEIARVKNKYNERAIKMELAQAVAQTAIAAVNAYASAAKVAWWLGPIAAAMATAAGMIQIATIKKQHQAEAAGYFSGGYTTKDPSNHREVGVVHANEFVANHKAVSNPALAPVFRLIDHAQRNNSVGSLTSTDVTNAIRPLARVGAGGGNATSFSIAESLAGPVTMIAESNAATRAALNRLSENLENGIQSTVIMDGEQGLYKKLKRFEKHNNNTKR